MKEWIPCNKAYKLCKLTTSKPEAGITSNTAICKISLQSLKWKRISLIPSFEHQDKCFKLGSLCVPTRINYALLRNMSVSWLMCVSCLCLPEFHVWLNWCDADLLVEAMTRFLYRIWIFPCAVAGTKEPAKELFIHHEGLQRQTRYSFAWCRGFYRVD